MKTRKSPSIWAESPASWELRLLYSTDVLNPPLSPSLIPAVLAFAVPMSVLMGILAGLSRLSSDSEVVAFRTLGIRNARLLWPVFLFPFAGWLITSVLTLYLAPRANYKWVQTLTRSVLSKVPFKINPREFNESIPQTVLFIQDITSDNRWENIFAYLSQNADEP